MLQTMLGLDLRQVAKRTETAYSGGSWRELPIHECEEPLVLVPSQFCHSFYALEMRLTDNVRVYLRKSVFHMFLIANTIINRSGLNLVVYDGWRSVEIQENLFWHYLKLFTAAKFGLQDHFRLAITSSDVKNTFLRLPLEIQEKMKKANRTYASWPSADPAQPSPHATGGGIDVWPLRDGKPVELGVPFDWMQDNASAFYHLRSERSKFQDDLEACKNRELLLGAMLGAGFSCYPAEIWHFNYGNQMDSLVTGEIARYSYIEP